MSTIKWKKTLAETGLLEEKLSKSLKKSIKYYNELQEDITKAETDLQTATDDKKPEIQADITQFKSDLKDLDEALSEAITEYKAKQPYYAAQALKMQEARAGKKNNPAPAAQGKAADAKVIPISQQAAPKADEPPAPAAAQEDGKQDTPPPAPKEKKKGNGNWIILITGALVTGGLIFWGVTHPPKINLKNLLNFKK